MKEAFRVAILEVNVARRREPVVRPIAEKKSTRVREDLSKPSWLELKVLKGRKKYAYCVE